MTSQTRILWHAVKLVGVAMLFTCRVALPEPRTSTETPSAGVYQTGNRSLASAVKSAISPDFPENFTDELTGR
jgi:hypothetical protein